MSKDLQIKPSQEVKIMEKFDSGKYSVAFGFILHICCLLTYKKTAHYAYVTVIFDKNYLLYIYTIMSAGLQSL